LAAQELSDIALADIEDDTLQGRVSGEGIELFSIILADYHYAHDHYRL